MIHDGNEWVCFIWRWVQRDGNHECVKRGEESGIDWRMETIDFDDGLLLELFLTERKIRRAMQDELASSGCV